ncbi:MAG: ATP-binding protein [Alphaproteobacteria bacterium]|nr:ATP-binding protein [Alphaproteobacteria bacterium]MBM3654624.1 ATP-binding protein [Alphaproteobacteria bacterium]
MLGFSLKARLGWLIGVVLVATLLINLAIQLLHAGPRVHAEAGSNLRLVREVILTTIANLPEDEDPAPALRRLYASLGNLRHSDVEILAANEPPPTDWLEKIRHSDRGVPEWFVKLVGAAPRVMTIPVIVGGRAYSKILVISNPFDELEEIWSDMVWLAAFSLAVTIVFLTLVLLFLRYSLAPFDALKSGLAQLEAGKSGVRLSLGEATEFKSIAAALNSLGATLDRVRQENRELVNRLLQVQEDERKDIARDLHDEAGPCLFSIRATSATLQELASQPSPDIGRLRQMSSTIDKASESLQSLFRGLLDRLRPKGLEELGLEPALRALFASWALSHPEVDLRLVVRHDLSPLDEETALAVYRVVQEAVTNIFRHSGASKGEVTLEFGMEAPADSHEPDGEASPQLKVAIEDNGVGISQDFAPGMGLLGMNERVRALGGAQRIERPESGGTRIIVAIPLRDDGE